MRKSILATMLVVGTIATSSFSKDQYYPSMGQGNMMYGQEMHQGMMSEQNQGAVKYNQNTYKGMPYGTQNNMMNQYSMPYGNMHGYGMNNNNRGNQYGMYHGNMQGYGMHNNMMNQYGMHHGNQYGNSGYGNHMFTRLNLSREQNYKISILRDEIYLEIRRQKLANPYKGMMSYILDNGFDKESFMQNRNNQYQKIMEIKAIHMEKVFNVLTKEQIEQLKKYYENKSK